jgi:anaerobic magnesium-protoporphyrin IX monomethyl ester cyclase
MRKLDVLFVEPNSAFESYQKLSETYSAIETPTWSLLLAQSCRAKGFGVDILDCCAERFTVSQAVQAIIDRQPRLVVFVVYGQNPNSGTTNMSGAYVLAQALKQVETVPIAFIGSHTSAVPREVLSQPFVDFVMVGDGVYALHNLLSTDLITAHVLEKVKGIGWKAWGQDSKTSYSEDNRNEQHLVFNPPEIVVPADHMDVDLPGYAWDLIDFKKYRAHYWHANFTDEKRTPFASIYTSFGCSFNCSFCMISMINRSSFEEDYSFEKRNTMRYWSPGFILKEFEKLAERGVETVRISDEMYFLHKKNFEPMLNGIIERGLKFNMWAYSRIDTVQDKYLELFKKAGINWLALGVEAANQEVRLEITKGKFQNVNVRDVCQKIRAADINVIANYIFGLPLDTQDTMHQTLDLALELNTETANFYPSMPLPGSQLYLDAKKNKVPLPNSFGGYSFLGYESQPLATKYLQADEVLWFRDYAWKRYFSEPKYLQLVEDKFGLQQRQNVENMASINLRRKILGHEYN